MGPITFFGFKNVEGDNECACLTPLYLSAVNGFINESITPPPLLLQRSTYAQLGWCSCVRTYVLTSRWKILFTPYLVIELSPSAETWCVYVTSINDGTQILTFLEIHNNRDFLNTRFFCGYLIILNHELHLFLFSDRLHLLQSFPDLCTQS